LRLLSDSSPNTGPDQIDVVTNHFIRKEHNMRARILLAALLLVITATAAHSQDCPQITRYTISTADNGTAHFKIELTLMGEMMSIITKASEEGKRTEDFVLNPKIGRAHV